MDAEAAGRAGRGAKARETACRRSKEFHLVVGGAEEAPGGRAASPEPVARHRRSRRGLGGPTAVAIQTVARRLEAVGRPVGGSTTHCCQFNCDQKKLDGFLVFGCVFFCDFNVKLYDFFWCMGVFLINNIKVIFDEP